ncbi:hypothetical protein BUX13_RS22700 [Escherichia coli]|uniref:Uncharacterized protein n=3 Tax=Escherichia coli TaxID=562 RepID=Q7WUB3_ECOLX|nr:hypothetical protein [Escherichia coli]EEY4449166.1 hypothetical protein [Escherichia coli O116]EEY4453818.1 hypothetical protein [Escherichia coli O130]EFE1067315.1 hypothetical protein [Escherichia coli O113:H36]EFW8110116.1 hypothetical protein [Shigella sonnei]EHW0746725.1 hypothetical protein [Escherichia coli O48]EHY2151570.1 hypothetical protein [Escherichia coli O157]EIK3328286.1 hypothetical protein [Shigella flexneri]EKF4270205.1 hypothetical protein [Escherichia coli O113]EKF
MCISSPETNSWSVIYRKNSGEDINITSLTFKNSLLAARILMVPKNYMICILRNGESLPDMLINFALINITDRKNEGTNTIDGNWQADEGRRYRDNVRIYF